MKIVREYTREAGVRNLEQQVAAMNRKAAKKIVSDLNTRSCNGRKPEGLSRSDKFRYNVAEEKDQIGAVTGLAWTEVGGDTLSLKSPYCLEQAN